MAIKGYLAMTAAEFRVFPSKHKKIAWMACHFSPYGTSLSNLPTDLPEGSLLILNDRTPICGHDPELISAQLSLLTQKFSCGGLLLDFQRPKEPETAALVSHLLQHLPCPMAVSHFYAKDLDCPVFLPPVPLDTPAEEHLTPWAGREIWLDVALDGCALALTESGCTQTQLSETIEGGHADDSLCCHYQIEITPTSAVFRLQRTESDLTQLLRRAEAHGITHAVGLYQELGDTKIYP